MDFETSAVSPFDGIDDERNFVISDAETMTSLPYSFDRRHYKKDSRFVNDLYTLTYDEHESLDTVRLFSSFANQVSYHFSSLCCPFLHFAFRFP